mmetsp:Transcript_43682/g.110562  ORF Transcript_43682/g.110562 Transcript_43682/m.110562 type:complete len:344 (+) Transcript_43682:332-1363(+)
MRRGRRGGAAGRGGNAVLLLVLPVPASDSQLGRCRRREAALWRLCVGAQAGGQHRRTVHAPGGTPRRRAARAGRATLPPLPRGHPRPASRASAGLAAAAAAAPAVRVGQHAARAAGAAAGAGGRAPHRAGLRAQRPALLPRPHLPRADLRRLAGLPHQRHRAARQHARAGAHPGQPRHLQGAPRLRERRAVAAARLPPVPRQRPRHAEARRRRGLPAAVAAPPAAGALRCRHRQVVPVRGLDAAPPAGAAGGVRPPGCAPPAAPARPAAAADRRAGSGRRRGAGGGQPPLSGRLPVAVRQDTAQRVRPQCLLRHPSALPARQARQGQGRRHRPRLRARPMRVA